MIKRYRTQFNSQFTYTKYRQLQQSLAEGFAPPLFRIAETPVFIPQEYFQKCVEAGNQIISLIRQPNFKELTDKAIPSTRSIPNENDHPHFLTIDFAVCKDTNNQLVPQLIEVQGFPSLCAFQSFLAEAYQNTYQLNEMTQFSAYFNGLDKERYLKLLKKVIVGSHLPEEVIMMDIDPLAQGTAIDFEMTREVLGISVVRFDSVYREGKLLYYHKGDRKVQIKRIYNRVIFDELSELQLAGNPFDPRLPTDVEWVTHPNWFYRISKYILPFLKGSSIPESWFLSELTTFPTNLEAYVLKPLFSFGGKGVILDVTVEDIAGIAAPDQWVLQRKVQYEAAIKALDGGVKAEIRLMYLWPDGEAPVLCTNLVRMSRGKMTGVEYNADFDWVGGSVGFIEK